jgi:uncharacterized protein YjbI with pentapeptide repeats
MLSGARFAGADLFGARVVVDQFLESTFDDSTSLPAAVAQRIRGEHETYQPPRTASQLVERYSDGERDFPGVDLPKAALVGVRLPGVLLLEANLERARLGRAYLASAQMDGANLMRANLICANLNGATLVGATLTKANLFKATLQGTDLRDADLRGAVLNGALCVDTRWDGAKHDKTTVWPDGFTPDG